MTHHDKFYIDGEWISPIAAQVHTLIDPSTEAPFGTVALGSAADVDRAVQAARRAQPGFAARSKGDRIALLGRIADALAAREADVMAAISQEMGAPLAMRAHVTTGLAAFRQAIATLRDYEFEADRGSYILRREAIGVAGLIIPWNWPIQLLCVKLASAFAAGCTVVAKPSEYTPVSALRLAEVLHEAGVPKGAFNLVNGDGPTVGNAISAHPGIAIVSFTGSTRAGILVAEAAAASVKRVSQELGGKSAHIILPDADLAAAARFNVMRGFSNTGQSCHSPTRLLVHRSQLGALEGHLLDAMRSVRVGDPRGPATTMGPVVNRAQFERVQRYIQIGIDQGARLVCGGPGRPQGLERGYYIRPTIFSEVTPTMTIAQEEIFGPVHAIIAYDDEAEAIAIANGTEYGLGSYVSSGSRERALAVARQCESGRVFINGATSIPEAPMGGYKKSGNGREMGVFGLEEYLEVKAIIGA